MKFNEVDVEVSKLREDKKIEETIDEILNEKKIIPDTGDIFIDENNIFENDNIEEEDKKFILNLIDRTDFSMDRNIFPEEDDEKEEINPAIPKWEYKKDIMIEEIMMKKEPLAISEKSKEKIEEKKLIDEKIKVKDEFHKQKEKLKKNKKLIFRKRLNLRKRKIKEEDVASVYRKKIIDESLILIKSSFTPKRKVKEIDQSLIFIKKVPLHRRERFRKLRGKNDKDDDGDGDDDDDVDDDLVFVKKVPLYSGERLRKSAKGNDDVVFVKKASLHTRERLRKSEKDNNDIISTKKGCFTY